MQRDKEGNPRIKAIGRGSEDTRMILVGVNDFFFRARITQTAKSLGLSIHVAQSAEEILQKARVCKPKRLLLDLNAAACRPLETIQALKTDEATRSLEIVGYVSHVQKELWKAALQAGCDQVLPRSTFTEKLAELLVVKDQ
jgi:CheY-like chemotaxis protein